MFARQETFDSFADFLSSLSNEEYELVRTAIDLFVKATKIIKE